MEQVLDREVGELESQLEQDTRLSPASRELDLVVGLGLKSENDVDGTVLLVGLGTYVHLFGVEVSRLCNLTRRTHKVILGEQVTWSHTQLAPHDLLIQAVVTIDDHLVDACLLAFVHAHLQIDAVAAHLALHGDELVEEVSVVHIQVGDSVVVFLSALVEQFLVVDVTLAESQHIVEHSSGIDGIADPADIVDVVSLALVDGDVNIDSLFVVVDHAVGHDDSIAISLLVVLVNDAVEVLLVVAAHKLLLAEEFHEA